MRAKKTKNYGKLGNKIGCLISNFAIDVMKAEKPCKGDMNDPLYIDKYNKAHAKCVWGVVEQVFKALAAVCITIAVSSTCLAAGLPRYEIGDVGTNESQAAVIVGNRVSITGTGSKIISFMSGKATGEVAYIDKAGNLSINGTISVPTVSATTGAFTTLNATTANITTANITNEVITGTSTMAAASITSAGIGNLNVTGTGTIAAATITNGTATLSSATISGGNINGTTIGATTPAAGTFTTARAGTFEGTGGGNIVGTLTVQNLTVTGTSTLGATIPIVAKVYRNAAQTLATGDRIGFDTSLFANGIYFNSINNSLICSSEGYYQINAQINYGAGEDQKYFAGSLKKSGASISDKVALGSGSVGPTVWFSTIEYLVVGDYIQVYVAHGASAPVALDVGTGGRYTQMSMSKIR